MIVSHVDAARMDPIDTLVGPVSTFREHRHGSNSPCDFAPQRFGHLCKMFQVRTRFGFSLSTRPWLHYSNRLNKPQPKVFRDISHLSCVTLSP